MPGAVLRTDGPGAGTAARALAPETRRDLPRTLSSVVLEEGAAVLRVEAADPSSMRAALNSYLECLAVTENIDRITKAEK